jgi:prevent-host-death family protein
VTPAVYTIRSLRANLRAAIAAVRESRAPAIIAERGERPVAVLVDYASWAAQHGEDSGAEAAITPATGPAPMNGRPEPRPPVARAQPPQNTAPPADAGWGVGSASPGPGSGEPAPIPAGWRAGKSGWGA